MVSNKNIYYVYILFKTYKKGIYKYDDLFFDHEPFYVGKGNGKRMEKSKKDIKWTKNHHKINIIEKIHQEDLTVTSIKYKENLTEDEAFFLEKELVRKIGRRDKGLGPLANLTDGGEGGSGGTSRKGDWPELYKPVLQYDLDGNFIKEYPSIKHAYRENPHSNNISYCCQMVRDTSGGFVWRYKENGFSNFINLDHLKNRTQKGNFEVSVVQKNMQGEIINEFSSIKDAEKITGCKSSKIVLVCQKKRKHTKGFIFEYKK
jgi:hypothetical protein